LFDSVNESLRVQLVLSLSPLVAVASIIGLSSLLDPERDEAVNRLLKLIDEGLRLEEMGRELAWRSDEVFGARDVALFRSLVRLYGDLADVLAELRDLAADPAERTMYENFSVKIRRMHSHLAEMSRIVVKAVNLASRREPISRVLSGVDLRSIINTLKHISIEHERLTGRACLWFYDNVYKDEQYTFSALINDVTACHHGVVNALRVNLDPELTRLTDRVYVKRPNPRLVELFSLWESSLDRLRAIGLIGDREYSEVRAIVVGDSAEVRVAGIEGHDSQVRVVLDRGRVVAQIYNIPWWAKDVLRIIFGAIGVDRVEVARYFTFSVSHLIKVHEEYFVLEVKPGREELFFRVVLPLVTVAYLGLPDPILGESFDEFWEGVLTREEIELIYPELPEQYEAANAAALLMVAVKYLGLDPGVLTGGVGGGR
jgi:hypothetical protein